MRFATDLRPALGYAAQEVTALTCRHGPATIRRLRRTLWRNDPEESVVAAQIRHVTIDSQDGYSLSKFWEQVTGWREDPSDPNEPQHDEALIQANDGGLGLLFINVPEGKQTKNRVHLDLAPDTTRDVEVERLLAIGARLVSDHRAADGVAGFVVLADPEGNEFCIERNEAERAAVK